MADEVKSIPIRQILRQALTYFYANVKSMSLFWLINFLALGLFNFIEGGFSNPISIVWLLGYYIYWCVFFRFYFNKKPYILTMDIFGSIVPSTKIFFLFVMATFLLIILPFLPLFMGFNEKYLLFFEKYMLTLQNIEGDVVNQFIFSGILLIASPIIIARPVFAWMSSLQGLNGSFKKAFRKTQGNYWRFLFIMVFLNIPCVIFYEVDKVLCLNGWLSTFVCAGFFVYFNLAFAKMYDFFYEE